MTTHGQSLLGPEVLERSSQLVAFWHPGKSLCSVSTVDICLTELKILDCDFKYVTQWLFLRNNMKYNLVNPNLLQMETIWEIELSTH